MVMLGDYDAPTVGYWAAKYLEQIGWLVGPGSRRMTKVPYWMHFACDNDRFISWKNSTEWNEEKYFYMLSLYHQTKRNPRWCLVPDVVGDKNKTLEHWYHYAPSVAKYGWKLAFAAQDGMTPCDVPAEADVVFVGGTTKWKWRNAEWFCKMCPKVHVGRVGTIDRLWLCKDYGAESVDGTGWFRDGELNPRFQKLETFFEGNRQQELFKVAQCSA